MKNIFFIFCLFCASCNKQKCQQNNTRPAAYAYKNVMSLNGSDDYLYIYEFDGCEYTGALSGRESDVLSHRGRCKYCQSRLYNMQVRIMDSLLSSVFLKDGVVIHEQ